MPFDIEILCRRFEDALRQGMQPRIEEYLGDCAEPERATLLAELLALELEYYRQNGETPRLANYAERFAEDLDVVSSVLKRQEMPDTVNPSLAADADTISMPRLSQDIDETLVQDPSTSAAQSACQQFGDYELLKEISRGGMGVVYQARQTKLNRIVALKMILAGQLASDEDVHRFYSEAEAAAKLDHPGIVPVYEVGQHEGQHFFSMGFVEGPSLAARIRKEGPLPSRDAAELTRQIADAVEFAHQQGVIHRDLKPANVLLEDNGQPKVTDFGLAKQSEVDSGLTGTGQILGTPSYMPPEQALGKHDSITARSDVYALGATLYFLLTGRPPFQAGTVVETLRNVCEKEPLSPRQINSAVPRDLETICLKCLEKQPGQRYESAQHLADELRRHLAHEPIHARRITWVGRLARWCQRKPATAALCGSLLVAGISIAVAATFSTNVSRVQALSAAKDQIESQLDRPEMSCQYFEATQNKIKQAGPLDPTYAADATRRLAQVFTAEIRSALIDRPRLSDADIPVIQAAIDCLETADRKAAIALRDDLKNRRSTWQVEFDLRAPFSQIDGVFDPQSVSVNSQQIVRAGPIEKSKGRHDDLVLTRISCGSPVQLEAQFDKWSTSTRFGLMLNATKGQRYEFIVRTSVDTVDGSPQTFEQARAKGQEFLLEIVRNNVVLHRKSVSPGDIPSGPLKLWAQRTQTSLSLQVNRLTVLQFEDSFPLRSSDRGVFGIVLPAKVGLRRFRAQNQLQPARITPFELADGLFQQERFDEAQAIYQDEELGSQTDDFRQESRYKQGLCLARLNRVEQAAELFESVFDENHPQWGLLAACQLWVLRIQQDQDDLADSLLSRFRGKYKFRDFAIRVPADVRETILNKYVGQSKGIGNVYRVDPDRVREVQQVIDVEQFLSLDGRASLTTRFALFQAYELSGLTTEAIDTIREISSDPADQLEGFYERHYVRLLRTTNQARFAMSEIERLLKVPGHESSQWLLLERGLAHIALEQWQDAERDLANLRTTKGAIPRDFWLVLQLQLARGFLMRRKGDFEGARKLWKAELRLIRERQQNGVLHGDAILLFAIMAALCDELTAQDTELVVSRVRASEKGHFVLGTVRSMIPREVGRRAFLEGCRSTRGLQLLEEVAFDSVGRRERARIPVLVVGRGYLHLSAFRKDLSLPQEELLWQISETLYRSAFETKSLTPVQLPLLATVWKDVTGARAASWLLLKSSLNAPLRGPFSYVLAHRYIRSGKLTAALDFFNTAIADAKPGSLLKSLAETDRNLLQSKQGRILFENDCGKPIQLVVKQSDQIVKRVTVEQTFAVDLAPGVYEVECLNSDRGVGLSRNRVDVTLCERVRVRCEQADVSQ